MMNWILLKYMLIDGDTQCNENIHHFVKCKHVLINLTKALDVEDFFIAAK